MNSVQIQGNNWKGALASAIYEFGDLPKKILGMCVFVFAETGTPRYGEIATAVDELFPELQIDTLSICRSKSSRPEVSVIINKGGQDGL